jgi:hypothetical protein
MFKAGTPSDANHNYGLLAILSALVLMDEPKQGEASRMKTRKAFLEANLTKEDLLRLVPPASRRAKDEKSHLIDEAMTAKDSSQILSFVLSPDRLAWWQTLFLRSLSNDPKTKKEILSDGQVSQVLSKVKAEGLDSDLGNFLGRKLVLLKHGFVTLNRFGRSWTYALTQLIEDGVRKELSYVTADKITSKFHTSPEYAFINRYKSFLSRRDARKDYSERVYIPPVNPDIKAKPSSYVDRPCRNPMLGNLSSSNLFASDCLKFFS